MQSTFCSGRRFFAGLSGLWLSGGNIGSSGYRERGGLLLFPGRSGTGLSGVHGFAAARTVQRNGVGQITDTKLGATIWAVQQMDGHVILIRKNRDGPGDLRPADPVLQILAVFDLKVSPVTVRISCSGVAKRFAGLPDFFVTGTHEP